VADGIMSSVRCWSGAVENGTNPPAETQRSFCAKTRMTTVPTTKTGTDSAMAAQALSRRSRRPLARSAASVPSGRPNRRASTPAAPISSRVRGRRKAISEATE
jgi:hypothetical protein